MATVINTAMVTIAAQDKSAWKTPFFTPNPMLPNAKGRPNPCWLSCSRKPAGMSSALLIETAFGPTC